MLPIRKGQLLRACFHRVAERRKYGRLGEAGLEAGHFRMAYSKRAGEGPAAYALYDCALQRGPSLTPLGGAASGQSTQGVCTTAPKTENVSMCKVQLRTEYIRQTLSMQTGCSCAIQAERLLCNAWPPGIGNKTSPKEA